MDDSQVSEWIEQQGWERNPFNFRIYPDLMIGYEEKDRTIRNSIDSGAKFSLLLGETGAGKTTMLRHIEDAYTGENSLFYMSKPPITEEDLLSYIRDEIVNPGLFSRYFRSYSLYNIHEAVNKAHDGQIILLVDEGHEASKEVLEWLRTAIDHIDNLTVVAAGLPSFQDRLQDEVDTLYQRATAVVELESLDRDNTIDLVRERIGKVGGTGTDPFTQSALLAIYEETEGFPREVLRLCHECVVTAADEGKAIIDESDVNDIIPNESADETNSPEDESGEQDEESDERRVNHLTEKQRAVYEAVNELDEASSGDVVDYIGVEEYKSREHAVRSINNILRRLMEQEDLLTRERRGRTYLYEVA